MKTENIAGLALDVEATARLFEEHRVKVLLAYENVEKKHDRAHERSLNVAIASVAGGVAGMYVMLTPLSVAMGAIGLAAIGKAVYHHLARKGEFHRMAKSYAAGPSELSVEDVARVVDEEDGIRKHPIERG